MKKINSPSAFEVLYFLWKYKTKKLKWKEKLIIVMLLLFFIIPYSFFLAVQLLNILKI